MPLSKDTDMAGPAPPVLPRARGSIDELGVYDDARTYYTAEERHRNNRAGQRTRTYSQNSLLKQMERVALHEPYRRGSHGMDKH